MATNNDDIKWLYGKLKAKGYNIGTEQEFTSSLANEADRQWYYEKAKGMGLNIGSMGDFNSLYAPVRSTPQQQAQEPSWQPTEQDKKFSVNVVGDMVDMALQIANSKRGSSDKVANSVIGVKPGEVKTAANKGQNAVASAIKKVLSKTKAAKGWGDPAKVTPAEAQGGMEKPEFIQRMDSLRKGTKPGAYNGEKEFNPQTGKVETVYYDAQGKKVDSLLEQWNSNAAIKKAEEARKAEEKRKDEALEKGLGDIWTRHPEQGVNSAEKAWADAEREYYGKAERNRKGADRGIGNFAMDNSDATAFRQIEEIDNFTDRLTTHDLSKLMNEAWAGLGEEGQRAIVDDCYKLLRQRYPEGDKLMLYNQAHALARQQSDLRLYNLAVSKNMPKGRLDYFIRKVKDMNLLTNIGKGAAVNRVGNTGDMSAYEDANERYRQDGHKILDVTGMVAGFALDPTTWLSAGVGSAATRGALWAGGRWLAGRGASAAVTQAATRQFATSMTGRIVGGISGGAANFGSFEGIKEIENQFAHGGHIVG